jgi:DNA-binding NarL/FixJ family response regulator
MWMTSVPQPGDVGGLPTAAMIAATGDGDASPRSSPRTEALSMSAEKRVSVVLVDRHPLLRTGLRCALESAPDIEVVGEARSDDEALALLDGVEVDVVLIDPLTSCDAGMAAIGGIRARHPDVAIIAMSASADALHIDQALAHGASVYVVKSIHPGDLPSTIRQVVDGTVRHVRPQAVHGTPEAGMCSLSARALDREPGGGRALELRDRPPPLCISDNTVKHYLRQAYRKLGVHTRIGGRERRLPAADPPAGVQLQAVGRRVARCPLGARPLRVSPAAGLRVPRTRTRGVRACGGPPEHLT